MNKDTHSYKGWLNSDMFWKRALAVYGHALVVMGSLWAILFGLMMLVGGV